MSLVIDKIRRLIKGTDTGGVLPTIPASNDHTDGSWIVTDIYNREFFLNTADKILYVRCQNDLLRVNNNIAIAINTDTTNFTKNLSAADTTVQKALQTFNDANLGHLIQDNGTVKTARTNLNFIGFTVTDDSGNDATKVDGSGKIDKISSTANDIVTFSNATGSVSDSGVKINSSAINNSAYEIPTSDLIKARLDALGGALIFQGSWDATNNVPDLTVVGITTGYFWRVSVAGTFNLGGISSWDIGDEAVKTAGGWDINQNPNSTDNLPEGSINKYFLASRVLSTVLTEISFVTNSAIVAADSVLVAFGKLQAQINYLLGVPTTLTTTTVLNTTYNFIKLDSTGVFTVTLPSATLMTKITLKNINTGVITVQRADAELIDDQISYDLEQYDCMNLQSDGTNWYNI